MDSNDFDKNRRRILKISGLAAAALATGARPVDVLSRNPDRPKLFATDVGSGTPVLLIHGWTCDSHDWSWQLPVFEKKYRTVAIDLRGHGRSDVPASGAYRPADYVGDIERFIATRYAGEKFVIVGHSMGGQIGALLAARRPDLVSALVSIDGSYGFSDRLGQLLARTTHDLATGDPSVVVPAFFEFAYDKRTDPALRRWHARRAQGTPAHVVRESFGPLFVGPGQVGLGKASETLCRSLKVPVYHLCRDSDQASRMQPWFAAAKSRVDVWKDAGHWIMQDRPDEVNAAVTAWIDAL